jgi:hypothetical protein
MQNLTQALDAAEQFVLNTWQMVVQGRLPGGCPQLRFDTIEQRQKYIDSIKSAGNLDVPEANFFERRVIATSPIAQDTELGKGPWDMKHMLLNGPKARMSLDGTIYNIIPFRHGVPGGKTGANANFKPMPKDVYAAAKALVPTISVGVHTLKWGADLNRFDHKKLFEKYRPVGEFRERGGIGMPKHSHSIYEGMYKMQANYGKGAQSTYMTFRTVSEKSPEWKWWHPGRQAQPHLQFIIDYCRPQIEKSLHDAAVADLADITRFNVGMDITVQ